MFQKKVKEVNMNEEDQLVPIKKEKKSKGGNKDVREEIEKKAQEKLDALEEENQHKENTDENILNNARLD